MPITQTKVLRDFSRTGHLTVADLNLSNYQPQPGTSARLVVPAGTKSWDPDVPVALARAVRYADSWELDFVIRAALMHRFAAEIEAALVEIKASA